jgi:hypothetical protein
VAAQLAEHVVRHLGSIQHDDPRMRAGHPEQLASRTDR